MGAATSPDDSVVGARDVADGAMGVPSPGRRVIRWEWMARPSRDCVGREEWSIRISTIEPRANGTSLVTCAPLVLFPGTGPSPPETLPGTNARNRSSNGEQIRRAKWPQLFTRWFPGDPNNTLSSCRGPYPPDCDLPQARLPGVWVLRCCPHAESGASASPHFLSEAGSRNLYGFGVFPNVGTPHRIGHILAFLWRLYLACGRIPRIHLPLRFASGTALLRQGVDSRLGDLRILGGFAPAASSDPQDSRRSR